MMSPPNTVTPLKSDKWRPIAATIGSPSVRETSEADRPVHEVDLIPGEVFSNLANDVDNVPYCLAHSHDVEFDILCQVGNAEKEINCSINYKG